LSGLVTSDAAALGALTARVRGAFPDLHFSKAELIGYGEDNLVVVLDGIWIARFPRNDDYQSRFGAELNLLTRLAPISPIPVPHYVYVASDRSFGAYRKIEGREMTPALFAAMSHPDQRSALSSLADFLSTMHVLPAVTIQQPDGRLARTWTGEQFAALYRGTRREKIARVVSGQTLSRFDAFHDAFAHVQPGPPRLSHNDLTDDHILMKEHRVAGIIDFSDAAFGDPAIDFAWFWRLGEHAVDLVLRDYRFMTPDDSLKARSHWTFVRYMINQLWYGPRGKWGLTQEQTLSEIEPHLKKLGF
jgi:aminoglycoside 2''-phosphotransferase